MGLAATAARPISSAELGSRCVGLAFVSSIVIVLSTARFGEETLKPYGDGRARRFAWRPELGPTVRHLKELDLI